MLVGVVEFENSFRPNVHSVRGPSVRMQHCVRTLNLVNCLLFLRFAQPSSYLSFSSSVFQFISMFNSQIIIRFIVTARSCSCIALFIFFNSHQIVWNCVQLKMFKLIENNAPSTHRYIQIYSIHFDL